MNRTRLFTTLTGLLALGDVGQYVARSRLGEWLDTYAPKLTDAARALLKPPFTVGELGAFAEVAVVAAQSLKGVFAGANRAKIAQAVFVEAARAVLPDGAVEDAAARMLSSEAAERIIESAFQRLFGEKADAAARARAEDRLNVPQATTTDATLPEPTVEAPAPESAQEAQEGAGNASPAQESPESVGSPTGAES